jgi:hypothetical protein
MVITSIGGLVLLSLFLWKRLHDANSLNSTLRTQIASLKRQLRRA